MRARRSAREALASPLPRLAGLDDLGPAHRPDVSPLLGLVLLLTVVMVVMDPLATRCFFSPARSVNATVDVKHGPRVLMARDGRFVVASSPEVLPAERLAAALARERAVHPGDVLFVDMDAEAPYSRVLDLLDGARAAGFRRVGLLTERAGRAPGAGGYASQ